MADRNLALRLLISAQDGASRVMSGLRGAVDSVADGAKRPAGGVA